jgi:hypothetical protein
MGHPLRQWAYALQDFWDEYSGYLQAAAVICLAILVLPLLYLSLAAERLRERMQASNR